MNKIKIIIIPILLFICGCNYQTPDTNVSTDTAHFWFEPSTDTEKIQLSTTDYLTIKNICKEYEISAIFYMPLNSSNTVVNSTITK